MYELNHITGNSYYIQSPSKMGLVKLSDTDVCLIDSGNDKDAGRKVRQLLDANGWHLTAIYNTHSNADHIGGNRYLQGQTKCRIYAQGIECDITRHPVLEPAFLYGGFPPKDLRHKFLMAQESDAQELTPAVLPEGFELLQLPGHFFHMVGFRSPDDVVYLADCLSSRERNALFLCRRGSFLRFPARAPCRPASARIRCAEGAASRRRRRSVCFCPFLSPPSDIIRQLYSVIIHHIG